MCTTLDDAAFRVEDTALYIQYWCLDSMMSAHAELVSVDLVA
jgi:hypothetical protein